MRKIFVLLIGSLFILTSCGLDPSSYLEETAYTEDAEYTEAVGNRNTYVPENVKEAVDKINNLKEKYKSNIEAEDFNPRYIDIYDEGQYGESFESIFTIDNINYNFTKEYFDDVVSILDEETSTGLKDFVEKAYNMELDPKEEIIEKFGRTVVHVGRQGGRERNHITMRTRITDPKNQVYKDIYEKVSQGNYILENVYTEPLDYNELDNIKSYDLLGFVNSEALINRHVHNSSGLPKVRYEILLKDKEIGKVNILVSREGSKGLSEEDIDVFANLLVCLNIEEKDELIKVYENIFKEKKDKIKLDRNDFTINIVKNKGNNYIGERMESVYISISKQ